MIRHSVGEGIKKNGAKSSFVGGPKTKQNKKDKEKKRRKKRGKRREVKRERKNGT